MRRASILAAALALAACRVDVEGARCTVPGSAAECPAGQACGGDLRCSEKPAACPNAGPEYAADPAGSSLGASIPPTGASQPPACRFGRLGDALAAAGSSGTVRIYGDTGTVTFGAATGETFPIVVPAGVTLTVAPSVIATIQGDGSATPSSTIVVVQGTLQGVQVANVSMTGNGVDLGCGAGTPALRNVVVSAGATKLAKGVTLTGSCGATLEHVDASGATGAALDVSVAAIAPVTVTASRFHHSGTGIKAIGGVLALQPDGTVKTQVTDNAGTGIHIPASAVAVDATLTSVLVARNGGTGVFVKDVPATSKLRMASCEVSANGTASPQAYGASGRHAGGMLLSQVSLSKFEMQGNNFYGNHGAVGADELAFESSWTWPLTTSSCTTTPPNAFGCLKDGSLAVSVWPGGVNAQFTIWPTIPPTPAISAGVNPGSSLTSDGPCGAWSGICPP